MLRMGGIWHYAGENMRQKKFVEDVRLFEVEYFVVCANKLALQAPFET